MIYIITCLQLVLSQNKHLRLTSIASNGKLVDGKSSTLSGDLTGCLRTIMGWDRMGDRNNYNNTAHSPRLDRKQVMCTLIGQMIGSLEKNYNIISLYGSNSLNIHMHACTHTTIHTNLRTSQYVHTY